MKKIFTTKISLQSHNPVFSYPIIRLPRDLQELAGQIVNIYETEIEGILRFFIAPHFASLAKLVKPSDDAREIENPPRGRHFVKTAQKSQWARPDSNRRPPPCEGSFSN